MSYVASSWRRARRREGRHRGAPCGADELGDAVEPFFMDVVDGIVAQELVCCDERSSSLRGARGTKNQLG